MRKAILALLLSFVFAIPSQAAFFSKTSKLKGNLTVTGTINNAGAKALDFNESLVNGAVTNGTTTTIMIVPGHAGTVTSINLGFAVAPIGGTNTVAVQKFSNSDTMLNAATIDPTTLIAGTNVLPLTSVAADLTFTATDAIKVTYVAGTQGTAANSPAINIEFQPTDF